MIAIVWDCNPKAVLNDLCSVQVLPADLNRKFIKLRTYLVEWPEIVSELTHARCLPHYYQLFSIHIRFQTPPWRYILYIAKSLISDPPCQSSLHPNSSQIQYLQPVISTSNNSLKQSDGQFKSFNKELKSLNRRHLSLSPTLGISYRDFHRFVSVRNECESRFSP